MTHYVPRVAGIRPTFNQALIALNLLAAGAPKDPADRREEGALIAGMLRQLPPQRVFSLFAMLRERCVNNRRTRATIRNYRTERRDPTFDEIK